MPALDTAPSWCPLIENITEELEEEMNQMVYEEFKFVSYDDLEALNATHLVGTKMLKKYSNSSAYNH